MSPQDIQHPSMNRRSGLVGPSGNGAAGRSGSAGARAVGEQRTSAVPARGRVGGRLSCELGLLPGGAGGGVVPLDRVPSRPGPGACPASATRPCRLRSDVPGSREPLGASRGGWDEAVAGGVGGRGGPGLDPDLGEDVVEVARHRLAADHQGDRDLLFGGRSGQELEHLDLPSRERPRG